MSSKVNPKYLVSTIGMDDDDRLVAYFNRRYRYEMDEFQHWHIHNRIESGETPAERLAKIKSWVKEFKQYLVNQGKEDLINFNEYVSDSRGFQRPKTFERNLRRQFPGLRIGEVA